MSLFFKEFEKFYISSICFFSCFLLLCQLRDHTMFISDSLVFVLIPSHSFFLIIFLFKLHWCVSCSVFSPCFLPHTHHLHSSHFFLPFPYFLSIPFLCFCGSGQQVMDLGNGWQKFYHWSITLTPLSLVQLCPHHLQYTDKYITWHCVIFSSRIYTRSPYLGLHLRQKPSTPSEARQISRKPGKPYLLHPSPVYISPA